MEQSDKVKIRRLGFLLGRQEKIEQEIKALTAGLSGFGFSGGPTTTPTSAGADAASTIPAAAPSLPKAHVTEKPAAQPKPKSSARVKQGRLMGLMKQLSESDRRLVLAAKESQGIDDATLLAKKLMGKKAEKEEVPAAEEDHFEEQFTDI